MRDGIYESTFFLAAGTTATASSIVAAPGVGKRIVIEQFVISAAAAATITFLSGSTPIFGPVYLGVAGNIVIPEGLNLLCGINEALNYTMASTGSCTTLFKFQVR